jgi:hypothetical protein
VQGLFAFVHLPRIMRLWLRGKIKPLRTLLGIKTGGARAAHRLLSERGSR